MPDLGSILERESRTVEAPEPSMDRLVRRRERRERNQRIVAGAVALVVAAIGIGGSLSAFRIGATTGPVSGGGSAQPAPSEGGWLGVLPTVAISILIAVAVLGMTVLAVVRLRRRAAEGAASRTTSGARAGPGHGPAADTGTARSKGGSEMDNESDVRTPQAQVPGVPAERPRIVEGRKGPGGPWLVLAVIVAMLVGGLGWYRLSGEPGTKTVTGSTAYTTGASVKARVAFDGGTCSYSGPAELAAGTQIAFDYTSAGSVPSAMIFVRLSPGMTYEDVQNDLATHPADSPPPWVLAGGEEESEPTGARHQSLTTSPSEGVWAVLCGTSPETTNKVFMGTMLRVVGS